MTCLHLACKNATDIEILESLLLSIKAFFKENLEKVKSFIGLEDSSGVSAYQYCRIAKRNDLAVILEDFVVASKSVVDVGVSEI